MRREFDRVERERHDVEAADARRDGEQFGAGYNADEPDGERCFARFTGRDLAEDHDVAVARRFVHALEPQFVGQLQRHAHIAAAIRALIGQDEFAGAQPIGPQRFVAVDLDMRRDRREARPRTDDVNG